MHSSYPCRLFPYLCAASLAFSSCTVHPPAYTRPPAPIPAAYERGVSGDTVADWRATGWQRYFADPGLRTLIRQALANNRDMRAAVLRVEEARARYGIQHADRLPEIDGQMQAERRRTARDLSLTGKADTNSAYQMSLGLVSWELDFWGRIRSLEAAALEEFLAGEAAQHAFAVSLVSEVANTWLAQREYDQRIALTRQTIASREESLRIFARRYQVGYSSKLDLTQVQTLLIQARSLGAQLEQERESNGHYLQFLVGGPVDLTPQLGVLDGKGGIRPVDPGLPSALLINRPDIVAAEHRLIAAQANINAARAAFFPRIALTGAMGLASSDLENLFESGNRVWNFMPVLSVPIFNGGRLRANVDLAEVRHEQAVLDYERSIQQAFRDVADALTAYHWLQQQIVIKQEGLATQEERSRLARLNYESGATTYLDVLDAERDLLQAAQDVISVQRQLLSSQVNLFAALGGGPLGAAPGHAPGHYANPLKAATP